ncbi:MAG: hypothetical protein IJP03_01835 [Christensenellaceae bacterium]|nr:hypothetical protein [Christensenellaceae bacterium]
MQKFFDKLRNYDEKQTLLFQRIFGIIAGIITFAAIVILGRTRTSLPWLLALAAFGVVFFLRNRIRVETGWNMRPYNIAMCIGMGIAIVAWLGYGAITGELFV